MKPKALVTGAGGELGSSLIPALATAGYEVVALDLHSIPDELANHCTASLTGDVTDDALLTKIFDDHAPDRIFHLAAILSSKAEVDPGLAHRVNVGGTLKLFNHCQALVEAGAARPRFLFPSTIAVYGLPDRATKDAEAPLRERDWNLPKGIYGCNKLYGELLGSYLSTPGGYFTLDFRSLRYPGLISAETLPTGGTTDYAPEMIHAAAQGNEYSCFVEASSRLPFMTMPDAVAAMLQLAEADETNLSRRVYNASAFSVTAEEIAAETRRHFPEAKISFDPVPAKQEIVDTWPADVNDRAARDDWGWKPTHGLSEAMGDYLVPALRRRYALSI